MPLKNEWHNCFKKAEKIVSCGSWMLKKKRKKKEKAVSENGNPLIFMLLPLNFCGKTKFFKRTPLFNLKNEFRAVLLWYQFIQSYDTLASLIRQQGLLRDRIMDGRSQCIIQSFLMGFSKARSPTTCLHRPFLELFPHFYHCGKQSHLL